MKLELIKENLNVDCTDKTAANIKEFAKLFEEYNSHTNLMSKNDVALLFEKHIFDSLAINIFLKKYDLKDELNVLDIGTGGGFPSIPLALCFENMSVLALDSIGKKIEFIKGIKEKLKLEKLNPVCSRVEDLDLSYKESFDIVTTRAVSDLNVILEYAIPYVKVGGYFIAYKSKNVDEEITNAKNALRILGAKVVEKIEYKLPLESDFTRFLVVIKKEKSTPKSYPRKSGNAKKMPL